MLRPREEERLLQRVEEIYRGAVEELERASKEGKPMLLRDSCEKGWLAVVEATNILLLKKGLGPAESHRDRREKLWKLEAEDATLRALGIHDRVNARAFNLHMQGFYEGALDEESIKRELEKVRKYIDDVRKL
ncbi:MAG: Archaeal PaREP1/PaREP8 family protein [Candidatus Bathyarchaeota archaeon BA1]|nr:MAG: Archaeal PaREP1/PaREP8 family protein [Candidatus Bathyarchaeota archaeon BA1]